MANPSITSYPQQTINTFVSKWNASSLPIVYTINNDKFPVGETVTNYYTEVNIYINGALVATINQIPDSNNNTIIDIRKYVQTALAFSISDTLRDTNATCEFYITGTENYVDIYEDVKSHAITGGGAGNVHYASLSALQFGAEYGGNMYDYVLDQNKLDLAKWMTFFERGVLTDSADFLLSIIVNVPGFDLEIIQYDINNVELSSFTTAIANEGIGLYRLSLAGVTLTADTKYLTVQALVTTYGTAVSELFTIDADLACAVSPTAPGSLVASVVNCSEIKLDWADLSSDESGFGIERKLASDPDSSFTQIGSTAENIVTYTDTTTTLFIEYSYRVRALGAIASDYTSTVNQLAGDSDAKAELDFIDDQGGSTTSTQKSASNQINCELKDAGLFADIQDNGGVMYKFIGGSAISCKVNAVNPLDTDAANRLSFFNSWAFASTGATPDGVSAYADTFFTPDTDIANAAECSYYHYSGTNNSNTGAQYGTFFGGGITQARVKATTFTFGIHQTTNKIDATIADSSGGFMNTRRAADDLEAYRNKVSVGTNTSSGAMAAPNSTVILGGRRSTVPQDFNNHEFQFFAIIPVAWTEEQCDTFHDIVQTFQTNLGR